jgi:hypothetical protein
MREWRLRRAAQQQLEVVMKGSSGPVVSLDTMSQHVSRASSSPKILTMEDNLGQLNQF